MLNLFERWKRPAAQRASVPDGVRVYAIGDVHGCKSQLVRLLEAIGRHRAGYAGATHLVFLGDLVNRGPHSSDVLEYLLTANLPADEVTFLMGNHEEMTLDCYDGKSDRNVMWLQFGGQETLASYGVSAKEINASGFNLGSALKRSVPPAHIAFMRTFQDYVRIGDYLFVHAGIRPGKPLEQQSHADLRWIRGEFLTDKRDHGFTVVHGHTIVPKIVRRSNRIGIDMGCYRTGILAGLLLEGAASSALFVNH